MSEHADECRLSYRRCRTCERDSLSLEDGECSGCRNGAEYQYELEKRRREESMRRGQIQAANVLRALAGQNVDPSFAAFCTEEAEYWVGRARR